MTELTRRALLERTPVTAAALGLLSALPAAAALGDSPAAAPPGPSARSTGAIVVHIADVATGEMTLLVGAREIVFRDPQLVARLVKAAA